MRNSGIVVALLDPYPTSIRIFQQNLWQVFGDPLTHMDVPVSATSTHNTDARRLRAPHLSAGARQMVDYLMFRKRSWKNQLTLGDLIYCLRLTSASNLLRNHCYLVLRHVDLIPKLDVPTAPASQSTNTSNFCTESGDAPEDLPRDIRRLLKNYKMEITQLPACPYKDIHALLRALSSPANRLIWVCQHLVLLHNAELEVGDRKWSHPRPSH
jgi:hypothetical protein